MVCVLQALHMCALAHIAGNNGSMLSGRWRSSLGVVHSFDTGAKNNLASFNTRVARRSSHAEVKSGPAREPGSLGPSPRWTTR